MRARNIKPAFFSNEELGDLSPITRLLFIGLWCVADREGRLGDRPKKIKAELFAYDNLNVDKHLSLLDRKKLILRYRAGNEPYIQIINFKKHQKPHIREVESLIPPPTQVVPGLDPGNAEPQPRCPDSPLLNVDTLNPVAKQPAGSVSIKLSQHPAHKLVRAWKRTIDLPKDDYSSWDKANFGRCVKSANLLLEIFGVKDSTNDALEPVADCMVGVYEELKKKGLECTLETVVKRAHEWKNGNNNAKH